MPKLDRIYTRKGDKGKTRLGGGQLVDKDDLRVIAYGEVDELNSIIGVAITSGLVPKLNDSLKVIQNELFHLGSDLCFYEEDKSKWNLPQIEKRHIESLEKLIDEVNEIVGPLENFILPGGTIAAAHIHHARTVCRRVERSLISLAKVEEIGEFNIMYLNRLSDALFMMSRYQNKVLNVPEVLWDKEL